MHDQAAIPFISPTSSSGAESSRTALILTADTGGGHRAVSEAIRQAVRDHDPDRLHTVSIDPLTGNQANWLLRLVCGWYGPLTRHTPWIWAVLFHLTNTRTGVWALRRCVSRLTVGRIRAALGHYQPVVVVVTHPLLVASATRARDTGTGRSPVLVLVTDLASAHRTWWSAEVDRTITPTTELQQAARRAGAANLHDEPVGIPVGEAFRHPIMGWADRARLRARLGLRPGGFLVLVTAGGEGSRAMRTWTRTILERVTDVDVVAICGRNRSLYASLVRLQARHPSRLRVTRRVPDMADWIRAADLVVSKAGPSTIAETTSLGVPLLLPTHLPGQEAGNTAFAVAAGAARRIRGRRDLGRTIAALRRDPAELARMRTASAGCGHQNAAPVTARLVAGAAATPLTRRDRPGHQTRKREPTKGPPR